VSSGEERLDEDHCEENQGCSQDDVLLARSRCLKIPRSDMNKMLFKLTLITRCMGNQFLLRIEA
jgi:hypothetical protein